MDVDTPSAKVVGILALMWIANYVSATQLGYPFLYCWLSPVAATIYLGWGTFALYLVAVSVAYHTLMKSPSKALIWFVAGIIVVEMPRAADYIFRLGVSCD